MDTYKYRGMKFMRFNRSYALIFFGAVAATVTFSPVPAQAWNLICGISVGLSVSDAKRKWDADSYANKGMGLFYMAISDLQRLQLNEDGTVENPTVLDGDERSSDRALRYLSESVDSYERALEIASQEGLGDERGLTMLRSLAEQTAAMRNQLADNTLPEVTAFHTTTQLLMEYTQYGIELSNHHLEMGMAGHAEGGSRFRLD